MINVFLLDYYTRLKAWHQLKERLENVDIETICVETDKFWQQVPILNHYLHPADVVDWPTPWELLNDNEYCIYARALGMIYTLLILGIKDVDLIEGLNDNNESICLVLVSNAKYTLNYYPDSVLNTNLNTFTNITHINITPLTYKIGKE